MLPIVATHVMRGVADVWPVGTSVSVYLPNQVPGSNPPTTGSVLTAGVVASDGSVTFYGLVADKRYVALANSKWRFFRTAVEATDELDAWPVLVNAPGLDRARAARALALAADFPIFYIGDSHDQGEYFDGATLQTTDQLCTLASPAKGLRDLLAGNYGDPGEGFWFPGDDRVVTVGGASTGLSTGPAVQRNNWRPTTTGQTKTVTIPAGITRFRIHSGNRAGETGVLAVKKNGVDVASVTSQNNDTPNYVEYACVAGDVFLMTGPSSSAITILGFELRTAQAFGAPVHRMGRQGYTCGNVMGGVYNGIIGSP
ncbi:MAG TPA: hypothetical protein VFP65_11250, partial [Anaeromyxobacteraceae bacterium]|nr:hypothetical protein [Anaeromyxobacteraceae bacterium]